MIMSPTKASFLSDELKRQFIILGPIASLIKRVSKGTSRTVKSCEPWLLIRDFMESEVISFMLLI